MRSPSRRVRLRGDGKYSPRSPRPPCAPSRRPRNAPCSSRTLPHRRQHVETLLLRFRIIFDPRARIILRKMKKKNKETSDTMNSIRHRTKKNTMNRPTNSSMVVPPTTARMPLPTSLFAVSLPPRPRWTIINALFTSPLPFAVRIPLDPIVPMPRPIISVPATASSSDASVVHPVGKAPWTECRRYKDTLREKGAWAVVFPILPSIG